ncbi:MAG: hypothetical protein AAGA31_18535, partial [Bacteroidota bacterium]
MKYGILTLLILLNSVQANGKDRIKINIPSAQAEAEYIWRTIQDINFFEAHNYQVSLPQGHLIEA